MVEKMFIDYNIKLRKILEVTKSKGYYGNNVYTNKVKGWVVDIDHYDWKTSFFIPLKEKKSLFKRLKEEVRLI